MINFLNSLLREGNESLMESIIHGYHLIFESAGELYISEYKHPRHACNVIEGSVDGAVVSELVYSASPNITYTAKNDRNPENYIYIEWIETKPEFRGHGFAARLIDFLKSKNPDKIIIAHPNNMSDSLIKKCGVTPITEAQMPWYPPRNRKPLNLAAGSYDERNAFGINSAFKAMSDTTKKKFLNSYVPKDIAKEVYTQLGIDGKFPKGSKMPVYKILDLPSDTIYSMAYNARELRNTEKDEIARMKKKPTFDVNNPNTWSENQRKQYDTFLKQQKYDHNQLKLHADEVHQRLIDDSIID